MLLRVLLLSQLCKLMVMEAGRQGLLRASVSPHCVHYTEWFCSRTKAGFKCKQSRGFFRLVLSL